MEECVEIAVVKVRPERSGILSTLDQQHSRHEGTIDLAAEQRTGYAGVKDDLAECPVRRLLLKHEDDVVPEGLPRLCQGTLGSQLGAVRVAGHLLFEYDLHQSIHSGEPAIHRSDANTSDAGDVLQ